MNLEIKKYLPASKPSLKLIDLIRQKYCGAKNLGYFMDDFDRAFGYCAENKNIHFEPIAVYSGAEIKAHIALIKDYRLKSDEAFFGFFETAEDIEVFNLLWTALAEAAKNNGIPVLKGPIDGSVWHQYRVVKQSDGSDFFKSEMICEPYYYNLLTTKEVKAEINYYSAYRENFSAILNAGQSAYTKLSRVGFSIQEIENVTSDNLQAIVMLSQQVFRNNWGFTELTNKEFAQLYSSKKLESHLSKLYFLYKGDDVIGFSTILKEDDSTLIFKVICVLPEYHGLGLGNALAFKVHLDAKEDGIKKIIYALIKEDNNIKNFPKDDAVIFRKYAAFEFSI